MGASVIWRGEDAISVPNMAGFTAVSVDNQGPRMEKRPESFT
jgi:hypothetical protein